MYLYFPDTPRILSFTNVEPLTLIVSGSDLRTRLFTEFWLPALVMEVTLRYLCSMNVGCKNSCKFHDSRSLFRTENMFT